MSRLQRIAVGAFGLCLVLVIGVAAASKPEPPDGVRNAALAYSNYLSQSLSQSILVDRYVRGSHPERFTSEISKQTFGDSVYYRTAYSLKQLAESGRPGFAPTYGPRPVPYPPKELWCVLLSNETIIVAAQHQDMYNADWVLHEVVDTADVPSRVGCPAK